LQFTLLLCAGSPPDALDGNQQEGTMAQIHNKDIDVPQDLSAQFSQLSSLFDDASIKEEFKIPDALAMRSKALFNAQGLLSLTFIILLLLIATWRFFLYRIGIQPPVLLLWVSGALGVLAFSMALSSHFLFKFQDTWLHNRFLVERLRQWKFQQLLDGELLLLSQTNLPEFDRELKARLIKAKFILQKPGALNDFLNAEDSNLFVKPSVCPDKRLAQEIFEAYQHLRLDYQAAYFSFKLERLRTVDIWTTSVANFSLLLAGLLALGEVILLIFEGGRQESNLSWLVGALALSAALISAATRVVRSAKAISEETETYANKWVSLKILGDSFKKATNSHRKLECMIETEKICVDELRVFIRTFSKSDYLL
jgi:hypothetical protein